MPEPLPLYLTNTLGRTIEEFQPIVPPQVRMYSCGTTVYSYAHIGNHRSFILADVLRRVLEYNGYQVRHIRNITDVGHLTNDTLSTGLDKIEAMAQEQRVTPWDIARYYTDAFLRDAESLNLLEPHVQPRATEFVPEMIAMTERLIESGRAYVADGNVYYSVSTFPSYGILSGNSVADLVAGARVELGEGKREPADFALWKAATADKIMRWPSPWGEGVPGWHIECSAMSMSLLGEQVDIHTGGVDNIFPHHEDERAQSEGVTGKPFVRCWLHAAWLLFDEEKMSKSLGNLYTLSDLADRNILPLAYRYFTFQAHYRTPLRFNWEALQAAQTALTRLWEATAELIQDGEMEEMGPEAEAMRQRFHQCINRDLDLPGAVAVIHEALGSKRLAGGQRLTLAADFDRVLGIDLLKMGIELSRTRPEHREILAQRAEARTDKDWAQSDRLRDQLRSLGLEVKDTAQGQRWVRRDLLPGGSAQAERSAK